MTLNRQLLLMMSLVALASAGCSCFSDGCGPNTGGRFASARGAKQPGAPHDRPFALGQNNDAFWETQQTNAEAADFMFYDHEFTGETAALAPGAKRHLEEVALRLPHVPFPVVIEQSMFNAKPDLDQARRQTIVMQLARLGVVNAEERVVIASAFAEGFTAIQGERAYYSGFLGGGGGGGGRRFGGSGGMYR